MKALAIVCLSSATGSANTFVVEPDPPREHAQLFGFRFGGGVQPIDGRDLSMMSLALEVEHRLTGELRLVGEYEYVWLGVDDTESENQNVHDGSGHRASLIARYPLFRSRRVLDEHVRFYVDVEAGGGFLLGAEPMSGTISVPHALLGIRVGYDIFKLREDTRASKVWEPEVLVRVIGTPNNQVGFLVGVGMAWGD